jgi:hypothetical protein
VIFYYDNENNVYANQWDAIVSGNNCRFYYHDEVFKTVDWTVEPTESLGELYKLRAQEIRDTYDYVIVCYSGGADSTNVLESFYYNNIHIDEIVMVGAFSQDKFVNDDSNHNGELYLNAFPTINQMNLPNTKVTKVDYTTWFADPNNFSLIKEYGNEWVKHTGAWRSVHHLFWRDFRKFVGQSISKKTCYVMGSDKLNFTYSPKASFVVCDITVADYGNTYENENFKRVNFYIFPEKSAMDIMRKQGHIIREWNSVNIDKIHIQASDWETKYKQIIYELRNPLSYVSPKSKNSSISERDKFMINTKNTKMYDFFFDGLANIKKVISLNEKAKYFTRPYYLE